jgi:hypothetical protein
MVNDHIWLVVWNMTLIFPYIGNNNPNWRSHFFERGRATTNQWIDEFRNKKNTVKPGDWSHRPWWWHVEIWVWSWSWNACHSRRSCSSGRENPPQMAVFHWYFRFDSGQWIIVIQPTLLLWDIMGIYDKLSGMLTNESFGWPCIRRAKDAGLFVSWQRL